jgi:hypothetical protein
MPLNVVSPCCRSFPFYPADFGALLNDSMPPMPITYDPSNVDGCAPFPANYFSPNYTALIERGNCTFWNKAWNAQAAGAVGLVLFDSQNNSALFSPHGDPTGIGIPIVMVEHFAGDIIAGLIRQPGPPVLVTMNYSILQYSGYLRAPRYDRAWQTLCVAVGLALMYWTMRLLWVRAHRVRQGAAFRKLKRSKYRKPPMEADLVLMDAMGTVTPGTLAEVFDTGMCSICLEEFVVDGRDEVIYLACGHVMHAKCLESWFADHDTCPMCKRVVLVTPDASNTRLTKLGAMLFSGRNLPAVFTTVFAIMSASVRADVRADARCTTTVVGLFALFFS